jgi:hypothetical protein
VIAITTSDGPSLMKCALIGLSQSAKQFLSHKTSRDFQRKCDNHWRPPD